MTGGALADWTSLPVTADPSDDEQQRAARYVAWHLRDEPDVAREILDMLGLT